MASFQESRVPYSTDLEYAFSGATKYEIANRHTTTLNGLFEGQFVEVHQSETHRSQGRFQKEIKGSSFVGVAATPLKPLPSYYRVKRRRD